ncbi:hypothetical protein OAK19_02015 [Aureispira]|nr:hypothetical protein [Aureispira sp.]
MKTLSLITIILLMSTVYLFSQATLNYRQVTQTISNDYVIIYIDTTDNIVLDFKQSYDDMLTIDVDVKSITGKKAILDYLKKDGRYKLKIYKNPKFYATVLSVKNNNKHIFINNSLFQEQITYTFHLPPETRYDIRIPKKQQDQEPVAYTYKQTIVTK